MKNDLYRPLFFILLILNILAVIVGGYYYWDQLASTPVLLLIFVPDCPLFVLLAIPIIAGAVKNDSYSFFVSAGMVKYGLWTVYVLLFYNSLYFAPAALLVGIIFLLGHIGMVLEGLALVPKIKPALLAIIATVGFLLLNDISDYFFGTVPPVPFSGNWDFILLRNLTFSASFLVVGALILYGAKIRTFLPVKFLIGIMESQAK